MLKTLLLATPVYVTLFWAIVLNMDGNRKSVPRVFLGKFMIFAVIIYLSHFLFFAPFPELYVYFDPFYQFASIMVYPMYYVYFRLLTVDERFSFKKHFPCMSVSVVLFLFYGLGVLLVPKDVFVDWVFHRTNASGCSGIRYLCVMYGLIRVLFIIQVVVAMIASYYLIRKYGYKAAQYYSDMEESSMNKVRLLNISMIITGVASIVLGVLGRNFFAHEMTGIVIASIVFSTMLFVIGWLGSQQQALNPAFELPKAEEVHAANEELTTENTRKLIKKLNDLFEEEKIYLNGKINIVDVANAIGSNRTYVSMVINSHFNQNFCTFVNQFRVAELERKISQNSDITLQELAESCGFGSVDSMKRAVASKTGMSFSEWKMKVGEE